MDIKTIFRTFVEAGSCTPKQLAERCGIEVNIARQKLNSFVAKGLAEKTKVSDHDVWAALESGKGGAACIYLPTDKAKDAVAARPQDPPPVPSKRK